MRLFIAIPIPKASKKEIQKLVSQLKKQNLPVKWETAEKWHLTLKFLGKTDVNKLEDIKTKINKITKKTPVFFLQPEKIGVFAKRQLIIWLSLSGQLATLEKLQKKLEEVLIPLDFPQEKRQFQPHLTLARAKGLSFKKKKNIHKLLAQTKLGKFSSFKVKKIVIIKSTLTSAGSKYQTIKTFPLNF